MNDMASFETDAPQNDIDVEKTAFEDESDTRTSAADGLQFSPLQNMPGIGKKKKNKSLATVPASPSKMAMSADQEEIE